MGKLNKRRRAAKRNRENTIAHMEQLARERAALAAADPLASETPTLPSVLINGSAPTGPSSWMGRGKVAVLAFAMAAMASVALLRACEHEAGPVQDDAAAPGSCEDDATFCVARA
jgi:hypothetical protein